LWIAGGVVKQGNAARHPGQDSHFRYDNAMAKSAADAGRRGGRDAPQGGRAGNGAMK
jgi:hypothetical protein